ncbi:MAG: hypothetical protein ACYS8Z_11365, partial [Planctomycetota bacterium]
MERYNRAVIDGKESEVGIVQNSLSSKKASDSGTVDGVEQAPRAKRRRGKWRLVLLAVLLAWTVAAAISFLQNRGVNTRLKALAGTAGIYEEQVRTTPEWYIRLRQKCRLSVAAYPIRLSSSTATDKDMKFVGRARKLRQLWLRHSKISDAGMVHLKRLRRIETLNLANTQ